MLQLQLGSAARHEAMRRQSAAVLVLTGMLLACSKHQRWRTLPDICAGPSGGRP